MRAWLLPLLGVLALAAMAAPALGHGGADLTAQPARALSQQALGLLTQQGDQGEAVERLEAALESENKEGVQISSVRRAITALQAGEVDRAVEQLNQALAPEEQPPPADERPENGAAAGATEEDPADGAAPTTEPAEEALADHTNAIEPDRGSAEWIGLFVGVGLLGGGALFLARRRTRD